jgi:hypothetical protein
VLGFSALQLAPALRQLVASGRLAGAPTGPADAPRIEASTPVERAALGYLHANCGHCHNASPHRAPLDLMLWQSAAHPAQSRRQALASMLDAKPRFAGTPDAAQDAVVVPGDPARSLLLARMHTREPRVQMPPIGTRIPDLEGIERVRQWISDLNPQEN